MHTGKHTKVESPQASTTQKQQPHTQSVGNGKILSAVHLWSSASVSLALWILWTSCFLLTLSLSLALSASLYFYYNLLTLVLKEKKKTIVIDLFGVLFYVLSLPFTVVKGFHKLHRLKVIKKKVYSRNHTYADLICLLISIFVCFFFFQTGSGSDEGGKKKKVQRSN